MAKFELNKTILNKDQYQKVIDTSFAQNITPTPIEDTITVDQFFRLYDNLFYDIPTTGDTNSHTYLVKTSGEYVGAEAVNEEIQVLLDEITSLQEENLNLNKQIIELQVSGSLSQMSLTQIVA
jgi:hypothetical protein